MIKEKLIIYVKSTPEFVCWLLAFAISQMMLYDGSLEMPFTILGFDCTALCVFPFCELSLNIFVRRMA